MRQSEQSRKRARRGRADGEIVTIIGWAFAGLAAFGGVAFLVKMAYWQPDKKKRRRR